MSDECTACGEIIGDQSIRVSASNGAPVDYRVCGSCGLMRQEPLWTEAELAPFYAPAYYGRGKTKFPAWLEWIRERGHRNAARRVRVLIGDAPTGAVLDVGCGSGAFLEQIRRLGLDIYGTELAGPAFERAAHVPGIHLREGVLRVDSFAPGQFAAITLWHVLEHLSNPGEVLVWCRPWLRPGGWLVIEVPNLGSWQARIFGSSWMHLDPPRHQYQFTARALERLVARCGFEVVHRGSASAQMGIFGALQSVLNMCVRPFNFLYDLLLARGRIEAAPAKTISTVFLSVILLPLAFLFWGAESLARRGAVLRFVCRAGTG